MATASFRRPGADEYAAYYAGYVGRVPDGDVVETLAWQADEVERFFGEVPPEQHEHRYAEGKWSVKEVVGHLADTERIMACRALCIARGEAASLPGFDENAYVDAANFGARTLESLLAEWRDVRRATLSLVRGLDGEAVTRRGTANNHPVSVNALVYIIAGHTDHHLNVLRTRYLATAAA